MLNADCLFYHLYILPCFPIPVLVLRCLSSSLDIDLSPKRETFRLIMMLVLLQLQLLPAHAPPLYSAEAHHTTFNIISHFSGALLETSIGLGLLES